MERRFPNRLAANANRTPPKGAECARCRAPRECPGWPAYRQRCRHLACRELSLETQARACLRLYRELLARG